MKHFCFVPFLLFQVQRRYVEQMRSEMKQWKSEEKPYFCTQKEKIEQYGKSEFSIDRAKDCD